MKRLQVGILAAGLGSRMQEKSKTKPLAKIQGRTLLEYQLENYQKITKGEIHCALREELLNDQDKATLLKAHKAHFLFVNTDSSLHTLGKLIAEMGKDEPILFSMVDTIIKKSDLTHFVEFCSKLRPGENAVVTTKFIDDEKPLWVHSDPNGNITAFNDQPSPLVTSGIYYLTPEARTLAQNLIWGGTHKMRNFLGNLVSHGICVKSFVVEKTIDVDHPSDLEKAEEFLRNSKVE